VEHHLQLNYLVQLVSFFYFFILVVLLIVFIILKIPVKFCKLVLNATRQAVRFTSVLEIHQMLQRSP
jgi:hypothetical protein